jgi:ribonuclease Y
VENLIDIAAIAAVAIVGFVVWWFVIRRTARTTGAEARRQAKKRLEEAEREAEAKLREAELAAKEKLLQARGEFEKVSRQHRAELEKLERRLARNWSAAWRKRRITSKSVSTSWPSARKT